MALSVFVGPIGLSHRGRDDEERRFQNPGKGRPILVPAGTHPLLLGVWAADEGGELPEPVVSVADVYRRIGRTTRFSVFTPLLTLREALACGWSEARSDTGERLVCFRLSHMAEFLERHVFDQDRLPLGVASPLLKELSGAGVSEDEALSRLRQSRVLSDAARGMGLAEGVLQAIYEHNGRPFLLTQPVPVSSADELVRSLTYLQMAAEELELDQLPASRYDAFARTQQLTIEEWPRTTTIKRLHGGWAEACDAAGLDAPSSSFEARFPAQRCREFLDAYVGECIAVWEEPSRAGYLSWRVVNGGPSVSQVERQLGSLEEQLRSSLNRCDA